MTRAAPAAPRGLRHVALRSRDLAATERVYVDVLGLRVAFPHRGMLFLESPGGGDLLNFVATRRHFDPDGGDLDHVGFPAPTRSSRMTMTRLARGHPSGQAARTGRSLRPRPERYTVKLDRN